MGWVRTIVVVAIGGAAMVGCGADDDDAGDAAAVVSDAAEDDADGEATSEPADAADDAGEDGGGASDVTSCEAVAALETSFQEDEPALVAAIEADPPNGLDDDVAVVREYVDRRQAGEDVYQDPDFLLEYANAVNDLREACG